MEKFELSPVELMSALNWKKSKVYYWINSGKFETIQRLDGEKVVISAEDMERLKKSDNFEKSEKFETVRESSINSNEVRENFNQNVTKNYKNVSNNLKSETFELLNKSLETIQQIHQASLNNFGYTTKLLTDGNNALEKENFELKAEFKTVQARLENSEKEKMESSKKFETRLGRKNLIIFVLLGIIVLLALGVGILWFSLNTEPQEESKVKIEQPVEVVTPQPAKFSNPHKK